MQQLEKPIGLLGGTFDPIHFAHLRMGVELSEALHLAEVHVIPCYQPVHRRQPDASATERLEMVKLAVRAEPNLIANDCEIRREGPSYMIDTILAFREQRPSTPLCLLIGIDAFLNFFSWHRADTILAECHLIVAHRPSYELPSEGALADLIKSRCQTDKQFFHQHLSGGLLLHPISALDISASNIRKQIAKGENPRYLLPNEVLQYIKQQGIYRTKRETLPEDPTK